VNVYHLAVHESLLGIWLGRFSTAVSIGIMFSCNGVSPKSLYELKLYLPRAHYTTSDNESRKKATLIALSGSRDVTLGIRVPLSAHGPAYRLYSFRITVTKHFKRSVRATNIGPAST